SGGHVEYTPHAGLLLGLPQGSSSGGFSSLTSPFGAAERERLGLAWGQLLSGSGELDEVLPVGDRWLRLRGRAAGPARVVGTVQEVTERHEVESRLRAEREAAVGAARAKSEFVSLMSHEIRTPLNAIMGLTHLLLQGEEVSGEPRENLNAIHFSSQNLLSLINNTLDFSRMEAGKIELERVNFRLRDLLKGIHRSLQLRASEKRLGFVLSVDPGAPDEVCGDPARLTQIVNNLASNAIKFTERGRVSISVDVAYQSDRDWVLEFTVSDTGVGVPADRQESIFESFVQASASTHRQYGGTGLGLAITKKIVELHRGSIRLRSEPGVGSEFTVRLRYARPEPSLGSLPASVVAGRGALRDARVLVIDDNAINKMVASKLLVGWEADVDTAGDGEEALEKVLSRPYDLVLMDLHMPGMSGFEAIEEMRRLGLGMPVVALTANASEEERVRILSVGGNDYLTKPFVPQELYERLSHHLAESRRSAAGEAVPA
ncbi:ATP-binding protein, partial [Pontibacter silvestris]